MGLCLLLSTLSKLDSYRYYLGFNFRQESKVPHSFFRKMTYSWFYGDQVVLSALSFEWGCRISVLDVLYLQKERFRHDFGLENAEFCLVYNGHNH